MSKILRFIILFSLIGFGLYAYYSSFSVISILLLLSGMVAILFILNFPSEWIEDAFATISVRLKVSSLLAGGLFLAIASSSTEFFTSMSGIVLHKVFNIGFDTLIWSSLFNLCLILGICTFHKSEISVSRRILRRDMPFFGISIGLLIVLGFDGYYSSWDFIGLITFYLVYVFLLYIDKSEPYKTAKVESWKKVFLRLFFGLLGIAVLAHTLVTFGQQLVLNVSGLFGITIPVGILAATLYGPGTSMADMFMSIAATKRGEDSAAVINSIGSNTFDLTICLAVPGLVYTQITGQTIRIDLFDSSLLLGMLCIAFILGLLVLRDLKITHGEGRMLILYFVLCLIIYFGKTFLELNGYVW